MELFFPIAITGVILGVILVVGQLELRRSRKRS